MGNNGTKDVKIMVPLKYLSNFWRTLKMQLINSEIILILAWSANCVVSNAAAGQGTAFAILQQLESSFKRTINWNKYQSKTTR